MKKEKNTTPKIPYHQIIARGKVQKWWSVPVEFKPAQLPYDTQQLVEDPYTPAHPIVTGVVRVPITITPTSAPSVQVSW